jgi:methyl halide transferase
MQAFSVTHEGGCGIWANVDALWSLCDLPWLNPLFRPPNRVSPAFQKLNCELLGLTVDSYYANVVWVRNIKEKSGIAIPFPIIEDLSMKVAHAYGMIQPGASDTSAVRATLVIDDKGHPAGHVKVIRVDDEVRPYPPASSGGRPGPMPLFSRSGTAVLETIRPPHLSLLLHSEVMHTHHNPSQPATAGTAAPVSDPERWNQRYREGGDGWELGQPAPPLEQFLRHHPLAPSKAGRVLVPGCGRGHEAALLAELGYDVVGLDFSTEAIKEARRLHGADHPRLRWVQADLFDSAALKAAGLEDDSLDGVVEHTCFCAIDPDRREAYRATVKGLLKPTGWLLGLFLCHGRPGGPPFGSHPTALAESWREAGMVEQLWQPAEATLAKRSDEWLGLWRKPQNPRPLPLQSIRSW